MLKRLILRLVIIVAFALSAPVFARAMSQPLELTQPATIGSTTLQPGNYQLTADLNSSEIRVEREGKLVATIEGKIVMLHKKPAYGAIVMDGHRIRQIQFSGQMQAIEIPNS